MIVCVYGFELFSNLIEVVKVFFELLSMLFVLFYSFFVEGLKICYFLEGNKC